MTDYRIRNWSEAGTKVRSSDEERSADGDEPAFEDLVAQYAGSVLRASAISGRANNPAMSAALQTMQRTHGNRAVREQ